MSKSIPWASIRAILAMEHARGASDKDIVNALMDRLDDEIDAWHSEVWNEIKSRTLGHHHVPELIPVYWVATQQAANGVEREARMRIWATITVARMSPDLWSDERLMNALAADWDLALAHGRATVTRNMNVIMSGDKTLYSFFLRPYAIMYFFYSAGSQFVRAYILGGMYRVLQTIAYYLPEDSKLAPYLQTAFDVTENLMYFTDRLRASVAAAWPALRKFMTVLLTAPLGILPALSPLGTLVGVAGISFVVGCLLGEAIFKGILPALGVNFPHASEEELKAQVAPGLYEQLKADASAIGQKVNAIFKEVSDVKDKFEKGGLDAIKAAPPQLDVVDRLKNLKEQVAQLSMPYGSEYLGVLKTGLSEFIDEVINKITVARQGVRLGAAEKVGRRDEEFEQYIDYFEVFQMLSPYFNDAIKTKQDEVKRELTRDEVEAIIRDQIKAHKAELEAYGESLAEKIRDEQQSAADPEVGATQVATEVIDNIKQLADSDADVASFESELQTLRDIITYLTGERKTMVQSVIDQVTVMIDRMKEKNVQEDTKAAGGSQH